MEGTVWVGGYGPICNVCTSVQTFATKNAYLFETSKTITTATTTSPGTSTTSASAATTLGPSNYPPILSLNAKIESVLALVFDHVKNTKRVFKKLGRVSFRMKKNFLDRVENHGCDPMTPWSLKNYPVADLDLQEHCLPHGNTIQARVLKIVQILNLENLKLFFETKISQS